MTTTNQKTMSRTYVNHKGAQHPIAERLPHDSNGSPLRDSGNELLSAIPVRDRAKSVESA